MLNFREKQPCKSLALRLMACVIRHAPVLKRVFLQASSTVLLPRAHLQNSWDGQEDRGSTEAQAPPYATRVVVGVISQPPLSPITPAPPVKQQNSIPPGSHSQRTDRTSKSTQSVISPSPLSPSTPSPPPGQTGRGLGGPSLVRQPYPLRRAPSPATAVSAPRRSPNSASPKPGSTATPSVAGTRQTGRSSLSGDGLTSSTECISASTVSAVYHDNPRHPKLSGIAGFGNPILDLQHGLQRPRSSVAQDEGIYAASEPPPQQQQRRTAGPNPSTCIRNALLARNASASSQAREPASSRVALVQQHPTTQHQPDTTQSSPAVWSLPIPRAVDLSPGGAFPGPDERASSTGPGQQIVGPPGLPPSFRKAVAMYQEAALASKQLLQEGREAATGAHASHVSAPANKSLQQHVVECGDGYVSRLNAHYGHQQYDPAGSIGAQDADHGGGTSMEDPQTLLAAIVAAQTWLMQVSLCPNQG